MILSNFKLIFNFILIYLIYLLIESFYYFKNILNIFLLYHFLCKQKDRVYYDPGSLGENAAFNSVSKKWRLKGYQWIVGSSISRVSSGHY